MVSFAAFVLLLGSIRPPCKAENVGEIWPPAANRDSGVMARLARDGNLRICTLGLWRHEWQSPTVTLKQMKETRDTQKGRFHVPPLTNR